VGEGEEEFDEKGGTRLRRAVKLSGRELGHRKKSPVVSLSVNYAGRSGLKLVVKVNQKAVKIIFALKFVKTLTLAPEHASP
jgi:hypothetical protein